MNLIASETRKFIDPRVTADGKARASVPLDSLRTVWFNTGTLCNLTCENCYIESSPVNDRLTYLTRADVQTYLREIADLRLPVTAIGVTGGEPFMNPDILFIVEDCLDAGIAVLILTNAMRPMMKCADGLLDLKARFGEKLTLRVSIDHFDPALHRAERGPRSWGPMVRGLQWLSTQGFCVHVAGRTLFGGDDAQLRRGFARLFAELGVNIDAHDTSQLIIFPEMDGGRDVPEITTECWGILGVDPNDLMCASGRMVVRRKGATEPEVVACTLLPHEPEFSYGPRLADSFGDIALNHPHCAKFCVLGGGSCSG